MENFRNDKAWKSVTNYQSVAIPSTRFCFIKSLNFSTVKFLTAVVLQSNKYYLRLNTTAVSLRSRQRFIFDPGEL
jgi:hypothetical protein